MEKFNKETQEELISTLKHPERFIAIHDAIVDDLHELAECKSADKQYEGKDLTVLVKPVKLRDNVIHFQISDNYKTFYDADVLHARLQLLIEKNIRPEYINRYNDEEYN